MCNALDDLTRSERGISTDSPAATRKIILMCKALRLAGVRPIILSMGRGGSMSEWKSFSSVVRRVDGLPLLYIPFTSIPILSQLLSAFALMYVVCKLRLRRIKHLIFYNRMEAFLPSLLASSVLRFKNILDLEDGEVRRSRRLLSCGFARMITCTFDVLCDRALLACSALKQATSIRPILCYYGAIFKFHQKIKFDPKVITVLMSGTLSKETGSNLLIDTIRMIASSETPRLKNIRFEITGKGESLDEFVKLARTTVVPEIVVHGRLTDLDYAEVLNRADVGLSLKLNEGPYANTTFPSKVIEYAAAGLLIVTTDISDVRTIFGDGALYLNQDNPLELIRHLEFIAANPNEVFMIAKTGQQAVQEICSPKLVGNILQKFIFGGA
ncbi:glycosyltransferase family 4 protein [Polynucleobacter sp. AP-Sving-400A-A2]|nr:glycosyltransferase family 4 protein [Polynucleobacter sp. AP-Sving-400A-A2]